MMGNPRCLDLLKHRGVLYGTLVVLTTGVYFLSLSQDRKPNVLTTYFPPTYGYSLLGLLYLCVLLTAVTEKRGLVSFVTSRRLLGKIGIVSYGVYLLHEPMLSTLLRILQSGRLPESFTGVYVTACALVLSFVLAAVSWILFEKRIVRWGRSFRYLD
jgi:peptidoglycan/LPS O-acetylase OafA/YrhL